MPFESFFFRLNALTNYGNANYRYKASVTPCKILHSHHINNVSDRIAYVSRTETYICFAFIMFCETIARLWQYFVTQDRSIRKTIFLRIIL